MDCILRFPNTVETNWLQLTFQASRFPDRGRQLKEHHSTADSLVILSLNMHIIVHTAVGNSFQPVCASGPPKVTVEHKK